MANDQISELESPFLEEKILSALKDSDSDKAPGPDDFPFRFAQSFRDIFKSDLFGLFQKFHSDANFDHRFSESFI